jgi:hypothetical protein
MKNSSHTSPPRRVHRSRRSARWIVLVLPLTLWACGCSRVRSQVPSVASGREALEAALTAWQDGLPVGTIDTTSPPVQVVDSDWKEGKKLAGYEILEETPRMDGRRSFKVRLDLLDPSTTREVNYVVSGNSPLWVFREGDFNGMSNWGGGGGSK